jgi:hypothetical protein
MLAAVRKAKLVLRQGYCENNATEKSERERGNTKFVKRERES